MKVGSMGLSRFENNIRRNSRDNILDELRDCDAIIGVSKL